MNMPKYIRCTVRVLLAAALLVAGGTVVADVAQTPLFLVTSAKPRVMLAMSVDHQLFKKAYPDYNDLDGDGVIDTSYVDTFDYDGYFDSGRCYVYSTTSTAFEPQGLAAGTNSHDCTGTSEWSGNFLNWSTMTRIDVLRKVLYGGRRSIDTSTETILERALLPQDVHSYVKVYRAGSGTEMARFTPYSDTSNLSMCNTTLGTSGTESQKVDRSATSTTPSLMRVAKAAHPLWATNEVTQCITKVSSTTLPSSVTADLKVRVKVCVDTKLEANCKSYGTSNKPTGILQTYGEEGALKFGLLSGSYGASHSGGLLRRALGDLAGNSTASLDEINTSNGTWATTTVGTDVIRNAGIISTLDNIRINRWKFGINAPGEEGKSRYQDCYAYGTPKGSATADSGYLSSDNSYSGNDATCSNWGNPVAELYLETLRYLAGNEDAAPAPNSAYALGGYTYEGSTELDLPNVTTWSDYPVPEDEWCAPLNVVLISSSDNSFDTDELPNVPSALGTINTSVDAIGTAEGLSGSVFAGSNGTVTDEYCTAKTFDTLSTVKGICPTAAALEGGYQVAGLAFKSHVTDLRPSMSGDQKVDTFVVALAKELPEFSFSVGSEGKKITVIPTCTARVASETATGGNPCSLTDLVVLESVVTAGKLTYIRFLAPWEDSLWGADYDKDGISMIAICVGAECGNHDDDQYKDAAGTNQNVGNESALSSNQIRVTARVVNAAGGADMRFGYTVAGTTDDGIHETVMRPGGGDENVLDSSLNPTLSHPSGWDFPEAEVFTVGDSTATLLPNPLIYAAKYGGFTDSNGSGTPDLSAEWDGNSDGQPDNYFFADNPGLLGAKLAEFFGDITTLSSSASVVANAAVLDTNTRIYQAQFNSDGWFGHLYSYPVTAGTGVLGSVEWDAAAKITLQDPSTGREIITWHPPETSPAVAGYGVAFRWAADETYMDTAQKTLLNTNISGTVDGLGSDRVLYIRGADVSGFRTRLETQSDGSLVRNVLGDIVHSAPALVGAPNFNYPDSIETALYSAFKTANLGRTSMLYVGSNDGMMHAIDATPETGGTEKLAYVPNAVIAGLPALTSSDYSHGYYVDAPPTVVDAYVSTAWRTILVSGLGGGGKAVFALDVTDPTTFAEGNASSLVKWEIDNTTTGFSYLGYTFSQPAIFKEQGSGEWVAAFGNGYGGSRAVLYIVRLSDGSLLRSVTLDTSSGNGLSTIAPVDTDNNGLVDLIYAGDLEGNVYRLKATSGGFTGTGGSKTTLYTAKDASGTGQAITTRLEVGAHPTSTIGRMVYVGTGTYYQSTDNAPGTQANSMYGIWDKDTADTVASVTTRLSTVLQQQEIIDVSTVSTDEVRVVSDNTIDWSSQRGWYIDLPTTGERMATEMLLRGGRLIFVTTIPSSSACSAGGDSWLMEINSATGGRLSVTVFDHSGDGTFGTEDLATYSYTDPVTGETVEKKLPTSGKKFGSIVAGPSIIRAGEGGTDKGGNKEYKYLSSSDGSIKKVTESAAQPSGRTSWLQLK